MADLNFKGDIAVEWSEFASSLKQCFILLVENEPDTICWAKNKKSGCYSIKLGYQALAEESSEEAIKWWWRTTWKWKVPEKMKILFWLAMEHKI